MDYKNIKIPFLDNSLISKKADLFRKNFWNDSLPVEIEDIIDLKLKLDIIPTPGLFKLSNTDALIASSWKCIYVDNDRYLDDKYKNRLRFSLAHEIGHLVLHKNIYYSFKIATLKDFFSLIEEIPQEQYWYLEIQANKFANCLLVPRKRLIVEKNRQMDKDKSGKLLKIDIKMLNSYLAIPLSEIFGVSEEAVEIALNELVK